MFFLLSSICHSASDLIKATAGEVDLSGTHFLPAVCAWRPISRCRLSVMLPLLTISTSSVQKRSVRLSARALLPRALFLLHTAVWCYHHLFSPITCVDTQSFIVVPLCHSA